MPESNVCRPKNCRSIPTGFFAGSGGGSQFRLISHLKHGAGLVLAAALAINVGIALESASDTGLSPKVLPKLALRERPESARCRAAPARDA